MGNFLVRYAPRVVIYDRRAVIRLATEIDFDGNTFANTIRYVVGVVYAGCSVQRFCHAMRFQLGST